MSICVPRQFYLHRIKLKISLSTFKNSSDKINEYELISYYLIDCNSCFIIVYIECQLLSSAG